MEYSDMLKRGRANLPEKLLNPTGERFEIPKVKGFIEGNKTIMTNFSQIVDAFRREGDLFLKFLQKELATPAQVDGQRLILGRKLPANLINQKIEEFAKTYVLCPDCGKPDTVLIKQDRLLFLKCQACGSKHPVKAKV
ncbi:translation initiation factor IF-2 subunit beta [Candidatus Woesearchaeota archaeon]|nr:translation initiation factor IF-2 subunit beta [Candidatus Woesearchaeota archaeon]